MITDSENFGEQPKIVIDEVSQAYMLETARWSKFLGVVMCVVIGIFLLLFPLMLKMNPQYQALSGGGVGVGVGAFVWSFYVLLIVGVYAYPLYALIGFSNKVKYAIKHIDQIKFNQSLRLLKNFYRYIGIFTIIALFFYGILIVFLMTIAITSSI